MKQLLSLLALLCLFGLCINSTSVQAQDNPGLAKLKSSFENFDKDARTQKLENIQNFVQQANIPSNPTPPQPNAQRVSNDKIRADKPGFNKQNINIQIQPVQKGNLQAIQQRIADNKTLRKQ